MAKSRVYIFKRFERFWHWAQAALVIFMIITGFEIHGTYALFGFRDSVELHTTAAWALIALWVFGIFWHLTTGEWRHYVPTTERFVAMIKFYSSGIFQGAAHPFRPSQQRKHNPLQLLAYLGLNVIVMPAMWITGLLYLFYGNWGDWGIGGLDVGVVAVLHTAAAFLMLVFLAAHLYLITTGETIFTQTKAMITGWDEVDEELD